MSCILKKKSVILCFIYFCCMFKGNILFAQDIDEKWVKENYTKREAMIPMRDGMHLYTAIPSGLFPMAKK